MKWLFYFIFFTCNLSGNTNALEVGSNFVSENTLSYTQYTRTHTTNIDELNTSTFIPLKHENLGYAGNSVIWTKVAIINTSDIPMHLIAFNPRAGMDIVDMYLIKEGNVIATYKMGDQQFFNNRVLRGRHSAIEFTIMPHESIKVISMLKNKGTIVSTLVISEKNAFFQKESRELMAIAMFSAFLIILVLSLVILSIILKRKVFYIYILHLVFMILYYESVNGAIYYISQGHLAWLQELMSYFGITLGLGCLWFFDLLFFRLDSIAPRIYKISVFLIVIFIFLTLSNILQRYYPIFSSISALLPLISLVIYVYSILMLVYILYKKLPYAPYYFVGHFIYHSSLILFAEALMGKIPETFLTLNIGVFGVIFEGIVVLFAMQKMLQKSLLEKKNIEDLLMAHSQFLSAGREMATIIHQWKIPLNRISSIVTYLESLILKKDIPIDTLSQSVLQMRHSIVFMNDTISSFYDFYRNEQEFKIFNVSEYINQLIDMFKPLLESNHIEIYNECSQELLVHSKPNILGHVLLILIQNAIQSLSHATHAPRYIKIQSTVIKNQITLSVINNGEVIKPHIMKNLFTKRSSSSKGLGFGLYLANFLITKELQGTISVENSVQGVTFKVSFLNLYPS